MGLDYDWLFYYVQIFVKFIFFLFPVDKLLSSEDGGGIFDDPPAITESVMMPPDHGDDEDDFDNLQSRKELGDIQLEPKW